MFHCKVSAAESYRRAPHSPSMCPSGLQASDFLSLRNTVTNSDEKIVCIDKIKPGWALRKPFVVLLPGE